MATEYVTLDEMIAQVPSEYISQAMDDDGEGGADSGVWDAISVAVSDAVDGPLGQRYDVPFSSPFPAIVKQAARVYCAEMLFLRRGVNGDNNPWTDRADNMRSKLDRIADGTESLGPDFDKEAPSGSVIDEPARTYSDKLMT